MKLIIVIPDVAGSTESRHYGRASIAFRVERSSAIDRFASNADRVIREMTY